MFSRSLYSKIRFDRIRFVKVYTAARKLGRTEDVMAYAGVRARAPRQFARPRTLAVNLPGWLAAGRRRPASVRTYERNAPGALPRSLGSVRPSVRPSVMTHFLDLMKQRGLCPSVRSSFSSSFRRRPLCLVNSDSDRNRDSDSPADLRSDTSLGNGTKRNRIMNHLMVHK